MLTPETVLTAGARQGFASQVGAMSSMGMGQRAGLEVSASLDLPSFAVLVTIHAMRSLVNDLYVVGLHTVLISVFLHSCFCWASGGTFKGTAITNWKPPKWLAPRS